MAIHCDNMVSLAYAKDLKFHGRPKHIDIHYNLIRDIVTQKEVTLEYNLRIIAGPLMKHVTRDAYLGHVWALSLRRWS